MQDLLFSPLHIGKLTVGNRIMMPAMHMNMCQNHLVSDQLVAFYAERARGGAGLISVGYATVDELSGQPGNIGAHHDSHIPGLARLAEGIKRNGAAACVQINHAGRYNHSLFLGGKKPVAPSAIPSRLTRETPRALEREEIETVVQRFAQAAARVRSAGFDAVEILAGTGYLISEFLSPLTNQRTDEYGGTLANRMRFGLDVLAAVRQATGDDFPILVRLNGNDFMPGGVGRDELQAFALAMANAGADALNVNVGWHEALVPQIVTKVPRGIYAYLARDIRRQVKVPVAAGHRINDPAIARKLLAEGACDLVAMGRALIADPMLPEKARGGRDKLIVHCVACAQGCFDNLFKMKSVECLCNPRVGREDVPCKPAVSPKKVLVVGGGAAGMSAALAAAERGHDVTLHEKEARLGGQLHLAGAPPGRGEFHVLGSDLQAQLDFTGVRVVLDSCVDGSLLQRERPDQLIVATGGQPVTLPIPGVELPHVVQAWELLSGKRSAGERVVVIGGGAVGVEAALLLAEEGTLSGEELKFLLVHQAEAAQELYRLATVGRRQVTVVELMEKLGNNFGRSTRWGMLQDLERFGVKTMTQCRVKEISAQGVLVTDENGDCLLPADTVVLAVGTRACDSLKGAAAEQRIPCQVVGDALQPAMVFDAIHQGYAAGRSIS